MSGTTLPLMFRRVGILSVALVMLSTTNVAAATTTVTMYGSYFSPSSTKIKLGNSVKWKNVSSKKHSATPHQTWSWSGVTVPAGTTSALVSPTQAGSFPYFCSFHPTITGKIKVPMRVSPLAGTTATLFSIQVGTVTAPGVLVHQIEYRKNGGSWLLRDTSNQAVRNLLFTSPGTYELRTRLRYQLGGATSNWSPITTIVVF